MNNPASKDRLQRHVERLRNRQWDDLQAAIKRLQERGGTLAHRRTDPGEANLGPIKAAATEVLDRARRVETLNGVLRTLPPAPTGRGDHAEEV